MAHPDQHRTLVMGARGSVGTLVLESLLERRVPVRASARRPEPGQFPAELDVVAADLTDPASLSVAFDGVSQVFLYSHLSGVDGVVDAARHAGVRKIVLMSSGSVVHPTSTGNAITEEHRQVEDAFGAASDLTVVPIRPLVLAGNALGWARSIAAMSTVDLYQPDALTAPIHEKDIAAVAVAALDDDPSPRVSDLLTGPARISQRDQVAAIAQARGKDIEVRELTRSEALARFASFMPAHEAEAVLQFLDDAAAGNSPATDTVMQVLGRPALTFDRWAADHVAEFADAQ